MRGYVRFCPYVPEQGGAAGRRPALSSPLMPLPLPHGRGSEWIATRRVKATVQGRGLYRRASRCKPKLPSFPLRASLAPGNLVDQVSADCQSARRMPSCPTPESRIPPEVSRGGVRHIWGVCVCLSQHIADAGFGEGSEWGGRWCCRGRCMVGCAGFWSRRGSAQRGR